MSQLIPNLYDEDLRSLVTLPLLMVITLLLLIVYLYRKPPNSPPGPRGVPFLGVLPLISDRPDRKLLEWAKTYGDVMSLPFINNNIIVLSSMEALNEGPVHKGDDYGDRPYCFFHDDILMRNGISSTNLSPEWKEQRRFTLTSLRKFGFGRKILVEKIIQEADFFCEEILKHDGDFSIGRPLLTELNANVIVQLCFNRRFDHEKDQNFLKFFHEVSKRFNDASFAIQATIFVPWAHRLPPFRGVLNDLRDFFVEFDATLIEEMKEHIREYGGADDIRDFTDDYVKEMNSRDDNNKGLFNETTLLYVLRDFYLAGTETMASTLTWAILILCNRKDTVLKKIQKEIEEIVGQDGRPEVDHKHSMHYTMAFFQELLRYRTILPFGVARMTTRDTKLGKFTIPSGTTVVENLYGVHNDPETWENPDEFIVERHLDSEGKFVKSPNVIAFGVGIRYCVGRQLAEMQMFVVLVRLLQRFDLVSGAGKFQNEEPAQGGFVTMAPFDMKIKLVERN